MEGRISVTGGEWWLRRENMFQEEMIELGGLALEA